MDRSIDMLGCRALLLLITLIAAPVSAEALTDSAVRVSLHRGQSSDVLSGVVIAHDSGESPTRVYVLTNAHGFRDGPAETMHVQPPNHPGFGCDRVDYCGNPDDKTDDLAIVSGPSNRPPPVAVLADEEPTPGTEALLVGYPRGGPMDCRPARLVPSSWVGGLHEYDTPAEQGMSGGPVYVAGRVASLIFGTGRGAMCVPLPRIRNLIRRIFGAPPLPGTAPRAMPARARPIRQGPGAVCPGGTCQVSPGPTGRQATPQSDQSPLPRPSVDRWPSVAELERERERQRQRERDQEPAANPVSNPSPSKTLNVTNPVHRSDPAAASDPDQEPEPKPDQADPRPLQPETKLASIDPPVEQPEVANTTTPPQGSDWTEGLVDMAIGAAGAAGLGLPTWAIFAYRASRRMRRMHVGTDSQPDSQADSRRRSADDDPHFRQETLGRP